MPADFESLKFLATLGVGGVLAAFIFYFSRKDATAFAAQWQGQAAMLLAVVKDNTVAITANTKTIEALLDTLRSRGKDER